MENVIEIITEHDKKRLETSRVTTEKTKQIKKQRAKCGRKAKQVSEEEIMAALIIP